MRKIIMSIVSTLFLVLSIVLLIVVKQLNVLPNKYFYLFCGIILLINIIGSITLFIKKKWTKIVTVFCYGILLIAGLVGIGFGVDTIEFLNKAFDNNHVEIATYDVVVLKSSKIEKLENLEGKTFGYLSNDSNKEEILKHICEIVLPTIQEGEDLYELYDKLLKGKIDSIVIDRAFLDVLFEEVAESEDKVKVIYSFDIETELTKDEEKDAVLKSMNIYISGSDSRSKTIQNKSRTDVNMILTINPDTKTVLMTSIPRDYYVAVHGKKGLKDKLTHTGIYGLDVSRQTLEDLFDIDISYSIKVGMNAVVELVDLVGGVDIYSDTAFASSHINGWNVKKGINHMDGKHALAYARERYAYSSGDRHRILNQQQVLEAVLEKVISDKAILTKYDKLLNSLSNLYRTDIPKSIITDLVKMQIGDMSSWTFLSNSVSGKDSSGYTYSMPNSKLYVMEPNESDVKNATKLIESVLKGTN